MNIKTNGICTTQHTETKGLLKGLEDLKIGGQVDHPNMHNPAPVRENYTHELLWSFDIQTDYLISPRRPDLVIINKQKRICKIVDFVVPADHRIKLEKM